MSFCYINGSYKNNIDASISVEDRGFNFSDGVYEVIAFRKGKLLNFERHLKRFDELGRHFKLFRLVSQHLLVIGAIHL